LKIAAVLLLTTIVSLISPIAVRADSVVHANADKPGSAIALDHFLAKDKSTLLFIHSPHCPPCRAMEPRIERLSDKKTDLKIVDVLLDAPSDSGIGFTSAAGNQFEAYSVPMFIIYDKSGKRIAQSKKANKQVALWLTENNL
jgi:thiol-disulfide isomerase/thioredoxin